MWQTVRIVEEGSPLALTRLTGRVGAIRRGLFKLSRTKESRLSRYFSGLRERDPRCHAVIVKNETNAIGF